MPPRNIKFRITTNGNVLQCGTEDTEYLRQSYRLAKLQNPSDTFNQKVIVDLYDHLYSIKMMHSLNHINILKCFTYNVFTSGNDKCYTGFLENFCGPLSNILENKFPSFVCRNNYIPSIFLTKLVRSIVDVLLFLHKKKLYHGALSWKALVYIFDEDGQLIVKLTNFLEKSELPLSQAQGEDWMAFGSMLSDIVSKKDRHAKIDKRVYRDHGDVKIDVDDNNCVTVTVPPEVRVYVDHLTRAIEFFQGLATDEWRNIPTLIENIDLFIRPHDRKRYAARLYHWCENDSYCEILAKSDIVSSKPWTVFGNTEGGELLKLMNNYKDKDGKSKVNRDYDGNNTMDFLKFISGLYAHSKSLEWEGHSLGQIDEFVCTEFPDLFYKLRRIEEEKDFKS